VDHITDAIGTAFLMGGLALSGYMNPFIGMGLLVAYLLLSIEVYLTTLALVAMALAGAAFGAARFDRSWLFAVPACLAVNWFGDSLDGTLARVRHHERPRYGFYVDHVLDVLCILFIFAGLVLGGHMSLPVGGGFLLAY